MTQPTDSNQMPANDQFSKLSLLYQENAKVAAVFWEWRHKILTGFFTGLAGLAILAGWFYNQPTLRNLLFAPPLIGTIFCFVCLFLDYRNGKILHKCYEVGSKIEEDLAAKDRAIFQFIGAKHYISYTWTLRVTFLIVGLFLAYLTYKANIIVQ